ncbi:MAG: DUF433 domain-containing protein [Candidatus Omnitrophica bacterium]|nr:DUF433 domain-containing protein [Candidatus Omnitrophota bacterium]
MMMKNDNKYISADVNICHGQPCFKNTRIMVYLVFELLEAGETYDQILHSYPQLTQKHITAALHFAAEMIKNQEYVPSLQPA